MKVIFSESKNRSKNSHPSKTHFCAFFVFVVRSFLVPVWAQLLPFFRAPDYRKDFGLSAVSERLVWASNGEALYAPSSIFVKKGARR